MTRFSLPSDRSERVRLAIVAVKFVTGTVEVVAASVLLLVPAGTLRDFVLRSVAEEQREDPNDLAAQFFKHHLGDIVSGRGTLGAALLALGAIKLVGAYGLLRRRPWGFYVLAATLIVLLPIDIYRAIVDTAAGTAAVVVVNALILALLLRFRSHFTHRPD